MADNIIQAVEILVDKPMTSRPELGLYSVSGGNAELRWTEAPLTGTTKAYAENILLKNGIGEIKESGNFENGGSPVQINNVTISIKNTNQFLLRLKRLSIHLSGLKLLIREFIGTDADSDATSSDVVFTGTIEDVSETIGELKIIAKSSFAYKRNRNIATVLNQDAIAPITYGTFNPTLDSNGNIISGALAKCVRTIDTEQVLSNLDIKNNPDPDPGLTDPITSIFPISQVHYDGRLTYRARLQAEGQVNFSPITDLTNLYVKVVDGTGEGQVRKVSALSNPQTFDFEIIFRISSYFETELSADEDSEEGQSWVQFIRIEREYSASTGNCIGFVNGSGTAITKSPELFVYSADDKKHIRIPNYSFYSIISDNKLTLDPKVCIGGVDSLKSYLILPFKNIELYNGEDLTKWGYGEDWEKVADGIYKRDSHVDPAITLSGTSADALDKNYSTFFRVQPYFPNNRMRAVLKLTPPDYPDGFSFDKIYLGCEIYHQKGYPFTEFKVRRFWGKSKTALMLTHDHSSSIGKQKLYSLPDNYHTPAPNWHDKYFYFDALNNTTDEDENKGRDIERSAVLLTSGLKNYELDLYGNDRESFDSIYEMVLIVGSSAIVVGANPTFDIYELALVFEKSLDIKSFIFARFVGLAFPSTWGGRKTAGNLIQSPVDILEHVKREQNWSDNNGIALIKTSGDGSFDDSSLAEVKALTPARQIFDYDKATTEALTKSICESFWLCSRQDNNGYECVDYLLRDEDPSETITYADLIDGAAEITDPRPQNIYCEPVINYCYDYGAEKFTKQLRITNSDQVDYDASYASGFEGSDGQEIWENCHILNAKYRQVEKMPSHLSDLHWVYTYADAVWVLRKRIEWMQKKRASFKVGYTKGRLYYVGKHIMLQLPHETNSVAVECVIEAVTKNKAGNRVLVSVVILDEIPSDFYFTKYQDTDGAETLWQDTDGATTKYQDGDA